MEYYTLLQLKGEPFSNSPDPDYFFQSRQHHACMQKLELAVRLKRGLNVVIGDVGTGKTTMCRELIRKFALEPEIETHLLLDPAQPSAQAFLQLFHAMLCGCKPDEDASENQIKEQIKQTLFQKGVDEHKTIVLIIDEGQKISSSCVEAVRELLNYETNQFKLLQIVIFAQWEFDTILGNHANFADRVNLLHRLGPMNFGDTRRMIYHRLKLASRSAKPRDLFTLPALWAIYRASRGYPRKIIHLCHQSILAMIIQNRTRVGWALVRSCRKRLSSPRRSARRRVLITVGIFLMIICGAGLLWTRRAAIEADHISPPRAANVAQDTPRNIAAASPHTTPAAETQMRLEAQPPAVQTDAPPLPIDIDAAPPAVLETAETKPSIELLAPMAEIQVDAVESKALPAAAESEPAPQSGPTIDAPTTLGDLAVLPGDTFLGLVRLVYGTNTEDYVRAVIEANPSIENPNAIYLNDVISFPALAAPAKNKLQERIRVVVQRKPTLSAARDLLNTLRHDHHLDVRLGAHWSPADGLEFDLVSTIPFNNAEEAREWIEGLPDTLKPDARLVTGWPEDTILYSTLPLHTD